MRYVATSLKPRSKTKFEATVRGAKSFAQALDVVRDLLIKKAEQGKIAKGEQFRVQFLDKDGNVEDAWTIAARKKRAKNMKVKRKTSVRRKTSTRRRSTAAQAA
jgi:hypothetical protein